MCLTCFLLLVYTNFDYTHFSFFLLSVFFFFQAEDGIRDRVRSRGLGDVYKRQHMFRKTILFLLVTLLLGSVSATAQTAPKYGHTNLCLLYTSDAADERSSVDLGGRRIIKKKTQVVQRQDWIISPHTNKRRVESKT